ncbi:MAG: signal peptidase I [Thermoanaerobaculia bacterium]|nr:signal peptidase I [Thermoanaerobaculia bacterium]
MTVDPASDRPAAESPAGGAVAEPRPTATPRRGRRRAVLRDYLEALLIAVIFATFARTFAFQAFKIPTGSMEQNLLVGDHILVNKFVYGPTPTLVERWLFPFEPVRRGDVVVFRDPEDPRRDFIKRCVGVGGDRVEIVDKRVYVNGELVEDRSYTYFEDPRIYPNSIFLDEDFRYRDNFGPYTVPDDHFFFLGDNRDNSNDSRFWGPVPASYVRGRAFLVYWSFEAAERPEGGRRVFDGIRRAARAAGSLLSRTRWERSLLVVR